MIDAPEQIWVSNACDDNERSIWTEPDEGGTEYTRTDLIPQWQSIDSAPKNTKVLISLAAGIRIAHFSTSTGRWFSEYGHSLKEPNKWMPLPPLPSD